MIKKKLISLATLTVLMCVFTTTSKAQFVVNSGTPDNSQFVSVNGGQFLAQEFELESDTEVSQIEAFLGTPSSADFLISLTTNIGVDATASDVLEDFVIPATFGPSNNGVWTEILSEDLSLSAGTYFLVFATDEANAVIQQLPVSAPNNIGQSFFSFGTNFDSPFASNFTPITDGDVFGVRVTGVEVASVPEPSSLMLGFAATAGLLMRRKR